MRGARKDDTWRLVYETFLASPQWAAKRAAILKRANGYCEACGIRRATECHHTVYPQSKLGPVTLEHFQRQPNWQIRACCTECHQWVHAA